MKQVAAENDLDISEQLKDLQPGQSTLEASAAASKEDNLSRRWVDLYSMESGASSVMSNNAVISLLQTGSPETLRQRDWLI